MGWLRKLLRTLERPAKAVINEGLRTIHGGLVQVIIQGFGEMVIDRVVRERLRELGMLLESALARLKKYAIKYQKAQAIAKIYKDELNRLEKSDKYLEELVAKKYPAITEADVDDLEVL